ncbi:MAG: dimethylsulfoxide reductase subunit B [Bacteroidales bacterium]|nr:dimethylsulfoxide reductase subunit B [Bacteroidales bacterium]MCF8334258.1 dimethylsulfoxide reductase subunit B [Bacteroidales bacterium]
MKKQYAFYIDTSRCSGCKTCQVACKDKNNLDIGVLWRRVYEVSRGSWTQQNGVWKNNIKAYNVSLSCNHCEKPVCVEVCPTGAMKKNKNGIVTIDAKKCIGCNYCAWACPYGAPQYDEAKGVMTKCDFCEDYLEDGKNPSCVDSCPMRVIDFGDLKELKKKYGGAEQLYPLPKAHHTKPAILIKPHKDAVDSGDSLAQILNEEEV